MTADSPDHDLLFGLLALQTDLITPWQLTQALRAWMADRQAPLAAVLVGQGALDEDDRADVEKLLGKHVRRHGDERAALAALRVEDSVRAALASLGGGFEGCLGTTSRVVTDAPAAAWPEPVTGQA